MNKTEAKRFVLDWLWESEVRLGDAWPYNYIEDVSEMVLGATTKSETQITDLLSEVIEVVRLVGEDKRDLCRYCPHTFTHADWCPVGKAVTLLPKLVDLVKVK